LKDYIAENRVQMRRKEDNKEQPISLQSRRRFLQKAGGFILAGVGLGGLAACGEQPTAAVPTNTPEPSTATPVPPTATGIPQPAATTSSPVTTTVVQPTATTMPPTATPQPRPLSINVYGDIRTAGLKPPPIFDKIFELSKKHNPQVVMLVGDIINADDDNSVVKKQWENHLKPFADAFGNIPVLPTIGNHETNYRKGATPLYLEAFPKLPQNGPEGFKGYVYSIDVGTVHFISLASELPTQPHRLGKEQLSWLEQDLKATRQPYILMVNHDPAYPVGPHKGNSLDAYPDERDAMWKLLVTHNVTAYIAGHEHLYNKSIRNGVPQLIIGTSGSYPYSGWGGDYYHYANFLVTQEGMNVIIIDEVGKERDRFTLPPRKL
jgi:hypothetical protein